MKTLLSVMGDMLVAQCASGKPMAVILAGHNGAGKSTMWYRKGLADTFKIPLINADRMMLSILPEKGENDSWTEWSRHIRDNDPGWMEVAQKGVEAFIAQAINRKVPFAMETVFSHWRELPGGRVESKRDNIRKMQEADYFVLLLFVGLSNANVSITRVQTRFMSGGHNVALDKLVRRFSRTQKAIRAACGVADAAVLMDNSRDEKKAFTVCRVQMRDNVLFDCRDGGTTPAPEILEWLDVVSPR